MASGNPNRLSVPVDPVSPTNAGNGGARIGRPPQWTESKSRKLARLYVYTTLPLEKIIKAVFPDDSVKKNSAQKTMHKMFGQDPRSLRPANRAEMNSRFKLVHKRSQKGRNCASPSVREVGDASLQDELKLDLHTPALSDITRFGDKESSSSPQQDSLYNIGSELTSPNTLIAPSPNFIFSPELTSNPFQAPFSPPARNDTVFSASTQMSTDSVRSIRDRLAVTTIFAKQVSVLMKRLTIGGSEDQPLPSPHRTPSDIATSWRGRSGPIPHPGLAIPGDYLVARRYVHACNIQRHFAKQLQEGVCTCWCTIADETSDEAHNDFYVTPDEDFCDYATFCFNNALGSTPDRFGNTPLHLFAALESQKGIDNTLYLIEAQQANPLAVNRSGQTFLHVLSAAWFVRLNDKTGPLIRLLSLLWAPELQHAVFIRDVYGRTFFHQLGRFTDMAQFNSIACHYSNGTIPRDAFGTVPPARPSEHVSYNLPRPTGATPLSPLVEEGGFPEMVDKDASMIRIVIASYEDPKVEDDTGRNGLQCLAEIRLDNPLSSTPTSPTPDQSGSNNGTKRKRGKDDPDKPKPVELRARYLEGLLQRAQGQIPADVNHYDNKGRTVLMSFATHLTDDQDKSGQHIGKIIDLLLDSGANLEARSRCGETALLLAARHGNKTVVNKLLDKGANIHARDIKGRGIMGVLDNCIEHAGLQTYGRLEVVRGILAKKFTETGAEDEPSPNAARNKKKEM
ncbi:hypothetical protein BD289DRAFT_479408 [Coniella lustricola]|uniref:Uncharacterized protein n=1 Tax=Coniella lustricola TaxID=2025994 RepID=A0A2T3AJ53_9PEZI|nr:hypothetical protein BD289DRAFT_479408 [Coniella lustricola]